MHKPSRGVRISSVPIFPLPWDLIPIAGACWCNFNRKIHICRSGRWTLDVLSERESTTFPGSQSPPNQSGERAISFICPPTPLGPALRSGGMRTDGAGRHPAIITYHSSTVLHHSETPTRATIFPSQPLCQSDLITTVLVPAVREARVVM